MQIDKGYVAITRTWKVGDTIELNLPMPIRRVIANTNVAADRGAGGYQARAHGLHGGVGGQSGWQGPQSDAGRTTSRSRRSTAGLLKGVEVSRGKAVALIRR